MPVRLAEIRRVLEQAYPPALAEAWDTGIGLTCGDPRDEVATVLLAVDVDPVTVDEAVDAGAQLLVTHHPLLFRAVQSVAADTPKGSLVHRLTRAGVAHFAAHTNADRAAGGVNDALAAALGLTGVRPLQPAPGPAFDKLVVMVPRGDAAVLLEALGAAGAGRVGNYSHAAFRVDGTGQFRPLDGAHPTIGEVGRVEQVAETRIDVVVPRGSRILTVYCGTRSTSMNSANRINCSSVMLPKIFTRRNARESTPVTPATADGALPPAFRRKNICNSGTSAAFCHAELLATNSHVSSVTRSSFTQLTSVGNSTGP